MELVLQKRKQVKKGVISKAPPNTFSYRHPNDIKEVAVKANWVFNSTLSNAYKSQHYYYLHAITVEFEDGSDGLP